MNSISRVLIANRSEIAVRILRACRELGLETVVTVSEADRDSLPARLADRAVCIGPPPTTESYLRVGTIITAALGTGAEAIDRMRYALDNFIVSGIDTTIPFHQVIMENPDFLNGKVHTRWVEDSLLKEYGQHEGD